MWAFVVFSIVVLHLIVGFGFMYYKLSPRKKSTDTFSPHKNIEQKKEFTIKK